MIKPTENDRNRILWRGSKNKEELSYAVYNLISTHVRLSQGNISPDDVFDTLEDVKLFIKSNLKQEG